MSDADPHRELERLRRERTELNEQVKLLVRTEQRLYRSQNELDAQLDRVRSLARFALESTGVQPPSDILGRALALLDHLFHLEWAGILRLDSEERAIRWPQPPGAPAAAARPLDEASWEWLHTLREPGLLSTSAAGPEAPQSVVLRAIAAQAEIALEPGRELVAACIPLRTVGGGAAGAMVALARRRAQIAPRHFDLRADDLPFMQLLADHVDRAIENAMLNESLRERSAELASSLRSLETTQQALLQAQKMEAIGRLAGGVAHDFNNLLTVVMGYAGLLASGVPPDSEQQRNITGILEAGQRAASITSQLLALGRRQMQRREDIDLSDHAARTTELLRRLVGEHIQIRMELDRGLAEIHADPGQIEQVLLNLVVNARDAMPNGGAMRVVTRRASSADAAQGGLAFDPRGFAALEVEDTGVGMDAASRARIFEPFFTTKGAGKGTGLGLAVVYGIVQQSDGHILVESTPGEGSRFTVLLPFSKSAGPRPAPSAAGAAPATSALWRGPGGRILLVEDEALIRTVTVAALQAAGYIVAAVENGEEALAWLASQASGPDLVLTDVVMPVMGGLDLARELRRSRPGLKVAFMSGYSEDLLGDEYAPERGVPFLAKPFTPQVLLAFVSVQLGARVSAP